MGLSKKPRIRHMSRSLKKTGTGSFMGFHVDQIRTSERLMKLQRYLGMRCQLGVVPTVTVSTGKTRSSAVAEGPHDASCQLKSCQLPCNSAETTCTTSPEQIEITKLEG